MQPMLASTRTMLPLHMAAVSRTSLARRALSTSRAGVVTMLQQSRSASPLSTVSMPSASFTRPTWQTTVRLLRTSAVRHSDVTVTVPPFGAESVNEGEVNWMKAVGDAVAADECIAELATSKTAVELRSPCNGVLSQQLKEEGDMVKEGESVAVITPGDAPAQSAQPAAAAAPPASAAPSAQAAAPPPPPPPSAPSSPPPPPIKPGVLQQTPVSSVKPISAASGAARAAVPPGVNPQTTISGSRAETRVRMKAMRRTIAARLKEAQNTCAMLTTFNEIDMSNIIELRKTHKDAFEKKHGIKLGFMSAFIKASAYALCDQPVVNAVIDDATNEIVYRDFVDVSFATATPRGLMVPVIRNVERMNFFDIEREVAALGLKARNDQLAIEDMTGGTFTVSNGGVFGSLYGTPIINPPQSAILGMHATFDRPVAINGEVKIRPMMYVALTYDHRLIDGREAVTFLRKIKAAVEDPRTILLDL